MEKVYAKYPETRGGGFLCALAAGAEPDDDTTFVNRKKAGAILEKLFALEPTIRDCALLIHTTTSRNWRSLDCRRLAGMRRLRRWLRMRCTCRRIFLRGSVVAGRHSIESGFDCGDAQGHRDAYGRRRHQFHAMDYLVYAYMQSGARRTR